MLKNKIDFAVIITAEMCNPNGDPLNGGRPRQDMDGFGEISDVCLKRKIRDRLIEMGEPLLMVPTVSSGSLSIVSIVKGNKELMSEIDKKNKADVQKIIRIASNTWFDVRAFGQLFPFKGDSASVGIRGPVTIGIARSIAPVEIQDVGITKSINSVEDGPIKDSSTFGVRHIISHGAYVAYGSIFPQLAELTGFSDDDAEKIHQALIHLFDNDASAARPSGSMSVNRLYWWKHPGKQGLWPAGKLFRALHFTPLDEYPYYSVTSDAFPVSPEIYQE